MQKTNPIVKHINEPFLVPFRKLDDHGSTVVERVVSGMVLKDESASSLTNSSVQVEIFNESLYQNKAKSVFSKKSTRGRE